MHPCIVSYFSPEDFLSCGSGGRGGELEGRDEKLKPERSEIGKSRINNLFCSSKPAAVLIAPDNDSNFANREKQKN